MNNNTRIVLGILAVYRVSHLISVDVGPGEVFARFRAFCSKWPQVYERLICVHCTGILVALPITYLVLLENSTLLVFLGIVGGQSFLSTVASREEEYEEL